MTGNVWPPKPQIFTSWSLTTFANPCLHAVPGTGASTLTPTCLLWEEKLGSELGCTPSRDLRPRTVWGPAPGPRCPPCSGLKSLPKPLGSSSWENCWPSLTHVVGTGRETDCARKTDGSEAVRREPEQEEHGLALWHQQPRRDYEECLVLCKHVHEPSTEGVQGREAGWGTEDCRWSSVEDRSHLKPRPSRLLLQVIAGPLLFHQPRAEAPCGQTEALTWGWRQDWDLGHTLGAHPASLCRLG